MSEEAGSYRRILRSTSIIGGSSVVTVLVGLVRTKIIAVLLGPTGIGMIGLFTQIMTTAATLGGMGIGTVATRELAEAAERGDPIAVATTRKTVFWTTLALASLGAVFVWLLRVPIAQLVFGSASHAGNVAWLGVGVALTIASSSQGAVLNGLCRIRDIAAVSILGSLVSAVLGVGVLSQFGDRGMVAFVIAAPTVSLVLGIIFVAKLPRVSAIRVPVRALSSQWRAMAILGLPFMLAGLAGTLSQLLVRSMVRKHLGVEMLGNFQASWTISATYLGFILGAMGTDYFPRVSGGIRDREGTNRLVNQQTEVALLLSGPALLVMMAVAPIAIRSLYAPSFDGAGVLLRWQVLGDVLRVASWPLGYLLLARGDGRAYLLSELLSMLTFALVSVWGLRWFGVEATGVAFLAMYLAYLPLVYFMARSQTGFTWHRSVIWQLVALEVAAVVTFAILTIRPAIGTAAGCVAAMIFGAQAIVRLSRRSATGTSTPRNERPTEFPNPQNRVAR